MANYTRVSEPVAKPVARNYYRPPGTAIHLHRIPLASRNRPVSSRPVPSRPARTRARTALDTQTINPRTLPFEKWTRAGERDRNAKRATPSNIPDDSGTKVPADRLRATLQFFPRRGLSCRTVNECVDELSSRLTVTNIVIRSRALRYCSCIYVITCVVKSYLTIRSIKVLFVAVTHITYMYPYVVSPAWIRITLRSRDTVGWIIINPNHILSVVRNDNGRRGGRAAVA